MKVTLTMELEVGDNFDGMSEAEIAQILFDDVINYNTVNHLGDSITWCARGKIGGEFEDPNPSYRHLFQHHSLWGEICSNATWTFKTDGMVSTS